MENTVSHRERIQKMGSYLSGMVMPNIGAFIAWGLITALFLQTGWIPNETLAQLIDPMKIYMLPMLLGYTAGYNVYGVRGGVIAAVTTMGAIVGADIPMFMGAMVVGPISAYLLKKLDSLFDGKIKPGLEMLVNNFAAGILGLILAIIAFFIVGPFFEVLTSVLTTGVNWIIDRGLIPLANVFIEPAKVLFLNNAINHGILGPIGLAEAGETGKSILFLLEPNPGPGLGILLAYALFGKGNAKSSALGVAIIVAIGGIHEPYFPFILMQPMLIIAAIVAGVVGTAVFSFFNAGLVATASPGSFFSILAVAPRSDYIPILLGIIAATVVSFVIAALVLKMAKNKDTSYEEAIAQKDQMKQGKVVESDSEVVALDATDNLDYSTVDHIIFACDAGMGSSAMGASVLRKRLKDAGVDMPVTNSAISKLEDERSALIVTQDSLLERAVSKTPSAKHETVDDFLNSPKYAEIVERFVELGK